jgi:hypothetical protein
MGTYHSFPRTVPQGGDYDEFGLDILRSIIDIGLVLAPEFIQFDETFDDGTEATLRMGQKRICLSDIESNRLFDHSRVFGRFSIEWSHSTALEMGAMPVFYFPEVVKSAPGLTNLTGTLIGRLAETVNLLRTLDELLGALKSSDPSKPMVVRQAETGEEVWLDVANTQRLLDHLNKRYRGFFPLSANLRGLSQLFCPTHNSSYTDPLTYYRQREWRIISDIVSHGTYTFRELTEEEKGRIACVNSAFFNREIDTFTGRHKRIDQCHLYIDPSGKHPLARATAVIVPSATVSRTEALLTAKGFSLPVYPLETASYGYV